MKKAVKNQSGQALLLVLLAMAGILIVSLSVASRSVTDISITSSEENALRAFSAAEAGIENSLLTGFVGTGSPDSADPNLNYETSIITDPAGLAFAYPSLLNSGESATFWFVGKDSAGNFSCTTSSCLTKNRIRQLCWGIKSSYPVNSQKPAVLVSVYYDETRNYMSGDYSNVKVARTAYDPYSGHGTNFNPVTGGTCSVEGQTYQFRVQNIFFRDPELNDMPSSCSDNPGCLILAKVKMFYNTSPDGVAMTFQTGPGLDLPAQGNSFESVGTAGESTRKLQVFQSFSEPPSIFDAAVFSFSDFSKDI